MNDNQKSIATTLALLASLGVPIEMKATKRSNREEHRRKWLERAEAKNKARETKRD
jgi:hypothetical protein